jgi:hypothetical protein
MFSAILILILLTELILYSAQVGIFEQRKSSNDLLQKQAFHAAEAGLQHAKEFFLANASFISYPGDTGWLDTEESANVLWAPCTMDLANNPNHPCSGEGFPRDFAAMDFETAILGGTYFYSFADSTLLPLQTIELMGFDPTDPNELDPLYERVEVEALLCVLDVNRGALEGSPAVQGCRPHGGENIPEGEHIYFLLTLLARGQAACSDPADPATCEAEALVAEQVGSFGPAVGDGGPGVPLTTRSNFPPGGTAEIVPNSNGGGPGVPISAWINGRQEGTLCDGQDAPIDPSSGSWSTCEPHEWYGVDAMPDDFHCPTAQCSCGTDEKRISKAEGGEQRVGIDIVIDPLFPCDLFQATFGEPKSLDNFNGLKSGIGAEIDDCGILDENSGMENGGVYWMTGDTCTINSNQVIGSKDFPVFLISAAQETRVNGGAELWGVLFVSDVIHADAVFESQGTNTVYGAVVVDAELGSYSGTFQIVYIDSVIRLASQSGGLGKESGGWTDFHPIWEGRGN